MKLNRRQMLKALGLGALTTLATRSHVAFAGPGDPPPSRIVFYVTPHGHVPNAWRMPLPNAPATGYAERSLVDLQPADMSEVFRPLHPFRKRLLAVEGLSHTSVLADIAEVKKSGGDLNNHSIGVAGLLTGTRARQNPGAPCTGGARSLDQELAARTAAPGRFGSRVYGFDYVPNSTVAPFSFLGPGQATPIVADPAIAFSDLMGYYRPGQVGSVQTREDAIVARRASVLDAVASEYDVLAPRLDAEGKRKLESHRDLVRQLETSLGVASPTNCAATFDGSGDKLTQFMRLIKLAFSCDLTRVATFVAPVPQTTEIGYPADTTMHTYAHESIEGATSCGAMFNPVAARAMTDLGVWYAQHLATLLQELDSVPEGTGTLLDHTVVVWVTELSTPTHEHHDNFTLLAGGCNDFFNLGRYVRYPREHVNPIKDFPLVGPAHNRLYVSLLQAMGQTDTTFGMTSANGIDGSTIDLTGPLTELHKA